MKYGLVVEESKDLETHLNLITDFTGTLPMMLNKIMSFGRWFLPSKGIGCCGRILVGDIDFSNERCRQFLLPTDKCASMNMQNSFSFIFF